MSSVPIVPQASKKLIIHFLRILIAVTAVFRSYILPHFILGSFTGEIIFKNQAILHFNNTIRFGGDMIVMRNDNESRIKGVR